MQSKNLSLLQHQLLNKIIKNKKNLAKSNYMVAEETKFEPLCYYVPVVFISVPLCPCIIFLHPNVADCATMH